MVPKTTSTDRIQTACLVILTTLAIATALYFFSTILIPFVLAVFLYYLLAPIISVQIRRLRFPRPLALATTILLASVLFTGIGLLITSAVGQIRANADTYQHQLRLFIEQSVDDLPLERFGVDTVELRETIYAAPGRLTGQALRGIVTGIMGIISDGILVLIFLIFLLAGKQATHTHRGGVLGDIESGIKRYTITLVATSATTGALVGLTLGLLDVSFAYMFGFLAFLLNFIPSIGSIIATLLPVPIILLSPELGWPARIAAVAIPTSIQFSIGNLLQPRLLGRSLDLHPITILLALIFFGLVWGIVGMFLATPIVAVVRMLFDRFDYTRPIGRVLSGHLEALER